MKRERWNTEKPPRKNEVQEFSRGKRGIIICDVCSAAYFKKRWYHGLEKVKAQNQKLAVSFGACPACKMVNNRQFEGKITLNNVSKKYEKEVLNLVTAYGFRAWDRDPMDRIIAVKKMKNGIVITTTENQLANKLARKLKQVFNKVVRDISFSPAPSDVVYITIMFTSN